MKKFLILLTSLVLVFSVSFANSGNEKPMDKKIAVAFAKTFASAHSISWTESVAYTQADFQINGQYLSAYFTPDGQMAGVSRNLTSQELPLTLIADLKKNYTGYWITELFEYAGHGSDTYYVTLENADKKMILMSNSSSFVLYKKLVK
ncbi:MAG TPA: hypothetical protein VM012_09100 [Flavitalea sp.]|nr:hypothetical protein [Flavitalea sp.]